MAEAKGMIELHQFTPAFGLPNPSPFCMKVETYLRMAGIPYEAKICPDPRKAPLGKLPFIRDGEKTIPDSTAILDYLVAHHGADLDEGLSASDKAVAHAYVRMLEEHSYFGLVYSRWVDGRHWPIVRQTFFGGMPPGVRQLVSALVQKQVKRDLRGHGLGRHPRDEIYARMGRDIDSIAAFLAQKPYFMGDRPTRADATVYAFMAGCWEATIRTPLTDSVGRHRNLVEYCARMKEKYFS